MTIYSIEYDLTPAGADALAVVQGSDHVSDIVEKAEHIFAGMGAGLTYLGLVILAPSGGVICYDARGEEGTRFLTNQDDAAWFVSAFVSDLPKAR